MQRKRNATHLLGLPRAYSIFAWLGNEKVPTVHAAGHMSVYMCQFPFDRDRPLRSSNSGGGGGGGDLQKLSSYDVRSMTTTLATCLA